MSLKSTAVVEKIEEPWGDWEVEREVRNLLSY
jgi:hypothetical protein